MIGSFNGMGPMGDDVSVNCLPCTRTKEYLDSSMSSNPSWYPMAKAPAPKRKRAYIVVVGVPTEPHKMENVDIFPLFCG